MRGKKGSKPVGAGGYCQVRACYRKNSVYALSGTGQHFYLCEKCYSKRTAWLKRLN